MVACFWCFVPVNRLINCMSGAASVGSHASNWSLAIHFHTIGWSLIWLLACLFSTLVLQVRGSWKSQSWKSQAASAINQASDWSLAIHFILKRLVACTTRCSVCFNLNFIKVHVLFLISLSFISFLPIFNLLLSDVNQY